MQEDIYEKLARHLSALGMGYPEKAELLDILREMFTPEEARIALAIPTGVIPFELFTVAEIAADLNIPPDTLERKLSNLSDRGLLFSGKTKDGKTGYTLQQFGYGFPQTFFWKGIDVPGASKMAELVVKYSKAQQIYEAYGKTETKPLRYLPATLARGLDRHTVLPFEMMEELIGDVSVIALVNCPCRAVAYLIGKKRCQHGFENCIKYDDLAEYLIEKGIGKEISKPEALQILKASEEAGLVHLADNVQTGIKHTCNCCSCCCWSVGTIRRRRIPRDTLMATYFLRETDRDKCVGCGNCERVCPVGAIKMKDDFPEVDLQWCIGCGVCSAGCPSNAIRLVRRGDLLPPKDFKTLHSRILNERQRIP